MKKVLFTLIALIATSLTINAQKIKTSKTHVKFFSTTPVEDIEANNYATVGALEPSTGKVVFSVPMQSFEFEKSLMQQHFNSKKFLDTKTNPKAKLIGQITNISEIDFTKDGSSEATVTGNLTINGVTKPISEKATINIKDSKINLTAKFNITLAEYEVAFENGKPSENIAKIVEVTVEAYY